MPEDVRDLFAEYADAYAGGERPRAAEYLKRAGKDADALATMIERFLGTARPLPPTADERKRLADLLDTPILEFRKRRRMKVDEVVDALMDALAIKLDKRAKLRRYYQGLENGTLDPRGVSEQVWRVLEQVLGASKLFPPPAPRQLRLDAEVAFYRVDSLGAPPPAGAPAGGQARRRVEQRDEVDELFLGPARAD